LSNLGQLYLSLTVSETDHDRSYWAVRPWASGEKINQVRAANLVIVPWEDKGANGEPLFPRGTSELFHFLSSSLSDVHVCMGIDNGHFREIAEHANVWRLPTLFISAIAIPIFVQVLGNRIDQWMSDSGADNIIESEIIIEGKNGRCISIKYKGPPSKFADTILAQAAECLPKAEKKMRSTPNGGRGGKRS
jgi:hypothetical protein